MLPRCLRTLHVAFVVHPASRATTSVRRVDRSASSSHPARFVRLTLLPTLVLNCKTFERSELSLNRAQLSWLALRSFYIASRYFSQRIYFSRSAAGNWDPASFRIHISISPRKNSFTNCRAVSLRLARRETSPPKCIGLSFRFRLSLVLST